MLQRSKPQRTSRRGPAPAKAASAAADSPAASGVDQPPGAAAALPHAPDDASAGERLPDSDVPPAVEVPAAPASAVAVEVPAAPASAVAVEVPAAPASAVGVDVPAEAASAAAVEPLAGPGIDPGVETAPTGPAPAGETNPAPAPSAATPVPPAIRAPFAFGTTLMETPMQQANKAAETMMKAAEEAVEFGRGNVEAMTKATQIYVAGVQDLGKQTFAVVQGLADHAMEGAKALSGVKSLQEAVQIQSNYARAAIEKSVSESAKLGEHALKLTEQTFAPITARMTLAAEKITKVPAAA